MNKNSQRILVSGRSGSGKSTYVKNAIKAIKRLVVFDPLDEYARADKSISKFTDISAVYKHIIANKNFRASYVPQSADTQNELFNLCNLLLAIQIPYELGKSKQQLTLVVEEMNQSYPTSVKLREPKSITYKGQSRGLFGFKQVCSTGRHYGINVYGVMQRIAEVNTNFRGNCSYMVIFAPQDHRDVQTLGQILGPSLKNDVINLQTHQYLHYENGQVKSGKNRV